MEKLDRGMQYKLVLLVAPASTGKALVLQEWVDLSENLLPVKPICLTLGPEDNQPDKFLEELIGKIQFWDPDIEDLSTIQHTNIQISKNDIGQVTTSDSGLPASIENVINGLINRLMPLAGDRFLIMLNYHHIENPIIHSLVAYLIDYLPPNLHLVITSQVTPPLQIPRLRARRMLLEIGPRDLPSFQPNKKRID